MRKLKVPGRIIGGKVKHCSEPSRDTSLPDRVASPAREWSDGTVRPAVSTLQFLTNWLGLWKTCQKNDDVDIDGRDRAGMPVKREATEPDIRQALLLELLNHVGILASGEIFPAGRCWLWETAPTGDKN